MAPPKAKKATVEKSEGGEVVFMPGSLAHRLDKLEIGETVAEAKRVEKGDMPFFDRNTDLDAIYGPVTSSVTRVQQKTNKKFRTERGMFITNSSDLMLVVTATRIE